MSSINDILNSFNIGFMTTIDSNKNPINFDPKNCKFQEGMKIVNTTPYTPPVQTKEVDGFKLVELADGSIATIPSKIKLNGHFQEVFLDENGNWDKKAEFESYKEKELDYKKEVIEEWLSGFEYDLQNQAFLMKALLEKTAS